MVKGRMENHNSQKESSPFHMAVVFVLCANLESQILGQEISPMLPAKPCSSVEKYQIIQLHSCLCSLGFRDLRKNTICNETKMLEVMNYEMKDDSMKWEIYP